MQLAFGMPVFEYLTQHPQESADFNRTMIAFAAAELPAVAEAYDFSGVHRIVDGGGGTGALFGDGAGSLSARQRCVVRPPGRDRRGPRDAHRTRCHGALRG